MANLILQKQGTLITWADSGASLVITLKGLASGAGRYGADKNFGVGAVAARYMWLAQVQFDSATAPVVGETIDIYLRTAPDGDNYDNDDPVGDAAVSAEDKLKNLWFLGSIIVDEAVVDVPMQTSGGPIEIGAEKVAPVFWNASADNLDDDVSTTDLKFILIPVPLEIQ